MGFLSHAGDATKFEKIARVAAALVMEQHLGTFCDVNCLYSETQVMFKLARKARGHFVTLIEIGMHLIRVNPGHSELNCELQSCDC